MDNVRVHTFWVTYSVPLRRKYQLTLFTSHTNKLSICWNLVPMIYSYPWATRQSCKLVQDSRDIIKLWQSLKQFSAIKYLLICQVLHDCLLLLKQWLCPKKYKRHFPAWHCTCVFLMYPGDNGDVYCLIMICQPYFVSLSLSL